MKKYTLKNDYWVLMHEGNKTSANVHTSSLKIYMHIYIAFLSMILKHLISHSLPSFLKTE